MRHKPQFKVPVPHLIIHIALAALLWAALGAVVWSLI